MRIDIGQTTNLFHVDAFNKNMNCNSQEKKEINILPRMDIAVISPMGKASSILQNLVNQIGVEKREGNYPNSQVSSEHVNDESRLGTVKYQVSKEGQDNIQHQIENGTGGTFSDKNLEMKNIQQNSIYYEMIENSDNGFYAPTIESQLRGTYSDYLDRAIEKGKDPDEDVYEYIANIHRDSLTKAYQDVYNDIVTGYENGTREVWTQNFEEGADYIEFELEGKNYRFHKLTMEEELARLDKAYEKEAKNVEADANIMIDTQKILDKVMPEYQEKMRQIEAQRAGRKVSEIGISADTLAESIKNKLSIPEERIGKINLFEMIMEARKNFLNAKKVKQ
jgi:hypothetical protein|nr:hypothetical protein [uncultured Schaedlerella sp.]